jgi:hypothetical protein
LGERSARAGSGLSWLALGDLMSGLERALEGQESIGAWLLGSDPALALTGRRAVPARLEREGFKFAHPEIGGAVRAAFGARVQLGSDLPR